ncbi:LemA family protein [Patescibacteria group bacterium]|nr:LemA family protein [Patescibacteria group bacterium]MBU1123058.1 LemA family protein [Patescibacteria group bacterium]
MTSEKRILFVILGLLVIAGLWAWSGYNRFVTSNENVVGKWAQVETQYQRRADLIPNLVNTVKGAAEFEQGTFIGVTEARTKWLGAGGRGEQIEAAKGMDSALARLLVTFESYPELKATQAYQDLMAQLEGTENRVAVARKDFNEAVQSFNVMVKRFPSNMLAGMFGFGPQDFFEADEGSENAPTVEF